MHCECTVSNSNTNTNSNTIITLPHGLNFCCILRQLSQLSHLNNAHTVCFCWALLSQTSAVCLGWTFAVCLRSAEKEARRFADDKSLSGKPTSCLPPAEKLQEASARPERLKTPVTAPPRSTSGRGRNFFTRSYWSEDPRSQADNMPPTHAHARRRASRAAFSFIWDFLPDKRAHGKLVKTACGIRGGGFARPRDGRWIWA